MKHKIIATLALVFTTTTLTFATGAISVPHIFASGQPARASDVNENFQVLVDEINALKAKQDPYSKTDDFVTTKQPRLIEGAVFNVDDHTLIIKRLEFLSFEEGNQQRYEVLYPEESISSAFGMISVSSVDSISTVLDNQKTSVDAFPVVFRVSMGSILNAPASPVYPLSGHCQPTISIKVDDESYFYLWGTLGYFIDTSTKVGQTECRNFVKEALRLISVRKL